MAEEMTKITVVLSTDLVERVRNACAARGERLAHIFTKGLQGQLRAMEHSNGQKFKPRRKALQVGRPMKAVVGVFLCLLTALVMTLGGCASAIKEVAVGERDKNDGMHFVVNRDVVNTRNVTPQHIMNGSFHCTKMRTKQEMSALHDTYPGVEFSKYEGCTPLAQHAIRHQYNESATGPAIEPVVAIGKSLVYSGVGAFVGHQIGQGIGRSGDNVTQQGGNAEGGGVSQNNGNTSTRSITQTNNNTVRVGK